MKAIEQHKAANINLKAKLIGMPGYELMLNEVEADKEKKMLELDSVLEQIILTKKWVGHTNKFFSIFILTQNAS